MSLECEGDGASCVECGEFDFLPHSCPYCHGVFCAAHASCHHVPASRGTGDAAALCVPPADPLVKDVVHSVGGTSGTTASTALIRCVVCQSFPCVLTPCPRCGESFCATHRFHGHEDAALQERLRKRAEQARLVTTTTTEEEDTSSAVSAGSIRARCAAFTASHPLSLAPVGYRSRRMDLLALVLFLRPSNTSPAKSPVEGSASPSVSLVNSSIAGGGGGGGGAVAVTADDVGLCSLIVATEMSVGQLRDRLETALMSEQEAVLPPSSTALMGARTSLFTIASIVEASSEETVEEARSKSLSSSQSSYRRRPHLSVVSLSADVVLRKAPVVNAAVVLAVVPAAASLEESTLAKILCTVLTEYLFNTAASAHQDSRVKALATRLYLQHQQLVRRSTAGLVIVAGDTRSKEGLYVNKAPSSVSPAAIGTAPPQAPGSTPDEPVPSHGEANTAAAATSEGFWPFRHAPPLNSFDFFNSKMSPCGMGALRPPTAPRIVVALFTADTALPGAVRPMCVALGKDWPMVRVADRLKEEVVEQQLSPHRTVAAPLLKTFSLYRLEQAGEGVVELLWETAAALTPASTLPLQSADVLVLCPPEPPGALAAVQAELRRLHSLTGKDKRALKADRIKLCSVM
ncbi:hypothetical protein ABB37_05307 [Leptomonas pyrrhocoris]|uniref:C2H2-type domain-containing protein n=1 Tax=Leptomonas pyrrhocoris TaxID=157538 RepID=A0A0N0VF36_LEPPY|nr:hypothetical protein ABB37_05307 [Leptomonas pyrrhocoris]KPA79474.1 hypothetical protein ABB37_05307 [Leptomonas pyrrhocoris]|eukprot:XP_015657913.1 hypothetical protein ABB37_05307 [Leptomonas pyrrhocoris]